MTCLWTTIFVFQEIVCDLVSKIGSSGESSALRSTALATLETLSVNSAESLLPFAVFASSVRFQDDLEPIF
jgi:hypothetical protein